MQNLSASINAPQEIVQNSGVIKFIRFFKSELVKVFIFLVIFLACVFYANSQSKQYYSSNKSSVDATLER